MRKLIFMKFKLLLFCIACLVVENNNKSLLALSTHENIPSATVNDDILSLTETICDLLLYDYSIDEIVALLNENQENSYNIQTLVTHIQGLLNQQQSKGKIVNIMVNNKESEEFYARKKFWAKIKNSYLAAKIVAVVVIIIVVCYLLYRYFKNNHMTSDNDPKPNPGTSPIFSQEPQSNTPPSDEKPEPSNDQPKQATPQSQASQEIQPSSQNAMTHQPQDNYKPNPLEEIRSDPLGPPIPVRKYNLRLVALIKQQIEQAKKRGVDFSQNDMYNKKNFCSQRVEMTATKHTIIK